MPSRAMTVLVETLNMSEQPNPAHISHSSGLLLRGNPVLEKRRQDGWSFVESQIYRSEPWASYVLSQQANHGSGSGRTIMNGGPIGLRPDPLRTGPEGWVPSLTLMPVGFTKADSDLFTLYVMRRLWELTAQYDKLTYDLGSRRVEEGKIDCSGWISFANRTIFRELDAVSRGFLPDEKAFKELFNDSAAEQIKEWSQLVGGLTTGDTLDPEAMTVGTLIGIHAHKKETNGRFHNIDHIVQVLYDPITYDTMITQSSATGGGVNLMKIDDWFALMRSTFHVGAESMWAVDPYVNVRAKIDSCLRGLGI